MKDILEILGFDDIANQAEEEVEYPVELEEENEHIKTLIKKQYGEDVEL